MLERDVDGHPAKLHRVGGQLDEAPARRRDGDPGSRIERSHALPAFMSTFCGSVADRLAVLACRARTPDRSTVAQRTIAAPSGSAAASPTLEVRDGSVTRISSFERERRGDARRAWPVACTADAVTMELEGTPPIRPSLLQAGDVIEGRYRLLNIIGQGGMGTVYLAEHVMIRRRVAVKVLHPELATDGEVVERFMNEARAAGTLGHPNIVESTDMGFARADVPYIVFEYLEGTPLSEEVYRLGGIRPRRALKIAHQIAAALGAAHSAGIVHCDLKSDNVFLTDKDDVADHVKVLDFGISRFLQSGHGRAQDGQRNGLVVGTPEFMAPEQLTAPDTVDARADIYALGVVLYEMIERRTPFVPDPKDPQALLQAIVLEPPPPFSRTDLPPGMQEMIFEKLLAKEPAKRYQSMEEVASAFEAFVGLMHRDTPQGTVSMPLRALETVSLLPPLARSEPPGTNGDKGRRIRPLHGVRSSVELPPFTLAESAPPGSGAEAPAPPPDAATSKDTSSPRRPKRRLAVVVAIPAACALALTGWIATRSSSTPAQAAEAEAPAVRAEPAPVEPAPAPAAHAEPAPAPAPPPPPQAAVAPASAAPPPSPAPDDAVAEPGPQEPAAPAARATPAPRPTAPRPNVTRHVPTRPARSTAATTPSPTTKPRAPGPSAPEPSNPTTWDKDSPLPPP